MSMFLAFYVDQIQEISCLSFRKILKKMKAKKDVWSLFHSFVECHTLTGWDDLYEKILNLYEPDGSFSSA